MDYLREVIGFLLCFVLPILLAVIWFERQSSKSKKERAERLALQRKQKRELQKLASPTVKAPQSRGSGSGTLDRYKTTSYRGNYVMAKAPEHPLAGKNGWLALHRAVLFDFLGPGTHPCYWCKRSLEWHKPGGGPVALPPIHVDHLDDNPFNNQVWNLAASCEPCNRGRSRGRFGAQQQLRTIHSQEKRLQQARVRAQARRRR
jgi:hypothetical protein